MTFQIVTTRCTICVSSRFLAAGDSYRTIVFSYRVGKTTVVNVVRETCSALWTVLQSTVMPFPDQEMWAAIATDFRCNWNFPTCCGIIDDKHVVMKAPPNAGTMFYNYKGSDSIVLLAVVDANYNFILVDIGAYGQNSDGGTFAKSNFGKALLNGTQKLPDDSVIPGSRTFAACTGRR